MTDKKKPKEKMAGDEMDVNAAQQIFSGAKQVLYNEDYTAHDDERDSAERKEKTKDDESNNR